jgi:excisionase family DNA binding protein
MLLTISEAAKLIGVCENTLRDWDENSKFRAVRTDGGHRRYSLDQVRKYLEDHQKVEESFEQLSENDKLIDKWQGMLEGISEVDKRGLAVLLENGSSYYCTNQNNFFTKEEYLWLTKESWIRTKLRKMVTVQPLLWPCGLVYFLNGNSVESEAVAAKTTKYDFKIFGNAAFDKVKDLYADVIAAELDMLMLDMLPRVNIETFEEALANKSIVSLKHHCDYVLAPENVINRLKARYESNNVHLCSIATMLDSDSFLPVAAVGRYPAMLTLPIFAPYILITVGPSLANGMHSCLLRVGSYVKSSK